jgi:hypothetical protein
MKLERLIKQFKRLFNGTFNSGRRLSAYWVGGRSISAPERKDILDRLNKKKQT